MSITTYAELQTACSNWLSRSDLTSRIPEFIALAESRINKRLRIHAMETTTASTIAAGVIAVPTNYIELKNSYISSTTPYGRLERKTADFIYDKYPSRSADDQPAYIAREGNNFIFGPYPDANYTVTLRYYNKLGAISSATNSVFTNYPGLWLYGALAESAPFLKDDKRVPLWEAKFKELLEMVQDEDSDEEFSGGPLSIQPG